MLAVYAMKHDAVEVADGASWKRRCSCMQTVKMERWGEEGDSWMVLSRKSQGQVRLDSYPDDVSGCMNQDLDLEG